MSGRSLLRHTVVAALAGLGGCSRIPGALEPHADEASFIARLFWIFLAVSAAVWLATMIGLWIAVRSRHRDTPPPLEPQPRERGTTITVSVLVALTGLTLLALTGLSYFGQGRLFARETGGLTVRLVGHQFWWEIQYEDADPSRVVTTANELHVPVGQPVTLKLDSTDVIHSFWIPSLSGKEDLIPGRQNLLQIRVERAGVYRGQCAEFCGWQHAHMGLLVVASPPDEFGRWRDAQLASAEPPATPERQRGHDVFMSRPCMMCHAISGTEAGGRVGPDLTHVASRRTLAAGTLPMGRGPLGAWITDPQGIKPGSHMPNMRIEPAELEDLISYLESLR
jgi:cytochrome c oxidase subunit 2